MTSPGHSASCYKCNEMLVATYADLGADKLPHCATCSSLTVCLTCESGYLLRVDKTGCIDNCKSENAAYVRDLNGVNCVTACAPGGLYDGTDATENYCRSACTTSATYFDFTAHKCKKCEESSDITTGGTDCIECPQGKCTKCSTKKLLLDGSGCDDNCADPNRAGPDRICVADCHKQILYIMQEQLLGVVWLL